MQKKNFIGLIASLAVGVVIGTAGLYLYQAATQTNVIANKYPKPLYHEVKPLVVSLMQQGEIHIFEVDLTVVTHNVREEKQLQAYQPFLRSNLISFISHYPFKYLANSANEPKFRLAALKEIRTIMQQKTGQESISDLLITKYVLE